MMDSVDLKLDSSPNAIESSVNVVTASAGLNADLFSSGLV